VKTLGQLVDGKRVESRGGQFEGKRNAIEPVTDVCDRGGVAGIEGEVRDNGARALDE